MRRRVLATLLALPLALTACGGGDDADGPGTPLAPGDSQSASAEPSDSAPGSGSPARGVTSEEAQLLAISRFTNFDSASRPFTAAVMDHGVLLELTGWLDFAAGEGYAAVGGQGVQPGVVRWDAERVGAAALSPDADGLPPLPTAPLSELGNDPAWQWAALDPASSRLDAVLAMALALGLDRPDNPLLVQQSGALWLRRDGVAGRDVTVFAAPPSDAAVSELPAPEESGLRLWLDETGTMWRAELRVGTDWVELDLGPADGSRPVTS